MHNLSQEQPISAAVCRAFGNAVSFQARLTAGLLLSVAVCLCLTSAAQGRARDLVRLESAPEVVAKHRASDLAGAATPRIVGGSTTTIASYPWQVALVYDAGRFSGNDFQRFFCGGELITPRIVQTAAHCLSGTDPDSGGGNMDTNDLDVVLGRTTLSATGGQRLDVIDGAIDGAYSAAADDFDAAWLVLSSASSQDPIKIAGSDESAVWAPGALSQASGWGTTSSGGSVSDTLRVATTPIISDASCAGGAVYGSDFHSSTMVCAGSLAGGVDSCQGDSGGPLQAPIAGGGYRLVGIVSWGSGCASPNSPGVYTRIAGSLYNPFAQQTVDSLETASGLPDAGSVYGSGAQPGGVQRTLTVSKSGAGSGAITASGINCPGDCSQIYDSGTAITLNATPAGGSSFAGWSGACSGTGGCQLTMDSDKSAAATFDLNGPPPDTTPPNTFLTFTPPAKTTRRSAQFFFAASEQGSHFQCLLAQGWAACQSPIRVWTGLGRYIFKVRAIDANGNIDPTPASWSWKVTKPKKRKK